MSLWFQNPARFIELTWNITDNYLHLVFITITYTSFSICHFSHLKLDHKCLLFVFLPFPVIFCDTFWKPVYLYNLLIYSVFEIKEYE